MKKLLIAIIGAAMVLGACGGNEPAPAPDETPEVDETAAGDFDPAKAQASYQTCAGCHGEDLQGKNGPAISGLPKEQVLSAITEGRNGMPPNMVTGEDAENLAAWVAAQ
jgi:cytochrome c551